MHIAGAERKERSEWSGALRRLASIKYLTMNQNVNHSHLFNTYRCQISQQLADLYKRAEQAVNRKEYIQLINEATKLQEQLNASQTI